MDSSTQQIAQQEKRISKLEAVSNSLLRRVAAAEQQNKRLRYELTSLANLVAQIQNKARN